jgi:1,4-dihydroxy-6-naphthoate synthase
MTPLIRLGISTCPNDTFAFHALMEQLVDWRGLRFEVELLDIQELNLKLRKGELDVGKASFFAALQWAEQVVVLRCGSALGFGVGPLLLAARPDEVPEKSGQLTVCPGQDTTASLLFQLFYPNTTRIEQVVFSEIMPRLKSQQADFGVCIHEGRFTWNLEGLHLVEDLGLKWESETGCPLPLGGIVASRNLRTDLMECVQAAIADSLDFARSHPKAPLPTMRKYAQEFDDSVLQQHVDLYVNQWTFDLGDEGRNALAELHRSAQQVGLISPKTPPLQILGSDTSVPTN